LSLSLRPADDNDIDMKKEKKNNKRREGVFLRVSDSPPLPPPFRDAPRSLSRAMLGRWISPRRGGLLLSLEREKRGFFIRPPFFLRGGSGGCSPPPPCGTICGGRETPLGWEFPQTPVCGGFFKPPPK